MALQNTGMILTSDLADNINDIHPKLKKEVGERFADLALAETCHQQTVNLFRTDDQLLIVVNKK